MTFNGNGNGNGMPKLEPIWLALGDVTWAMATALSPTVRTRFIEALERLADAHENKQQLAAFDIFSLSRRDRARAMRVANTFIRRLIVDLKAARG